MIGWVLVALTVAAYDAHALTTGGETMSAAYRAAFAARPLLVGGATAYLVGHLTGALPHDLDLFRRIG